eukprot:Skav226668  [mRNA]  locus=scaffold861:144100:146492:+ [translate_table: standard]
MDVTMSVLRISPMSSAAPELRDLFSAGDASRAQEYFRKDSGLEVVVRRDEKVWLMEVAPDDEMQVRQYLLQQKVEVHSNMPEQKSRESNTEEEQKGAMSNMEEDPESDVNIAFMVDFFQQQRFAGRSCVHKCLKEHSQHLRFQMTIPLLHGYQCKAVAVGKKACWEKFKESIGRFGRVSIVTAQDELRAAAAKSKLLDNVSSLKRAQETAGVLAGLMPAGGRPSKVRRTVTHLSEVLLLGSRVSAATLRSARESVADCDGEEEVNEQPDDSVMRG